MFVKGKFEVDLSDHERNALVSLTGLPEWDYFVGYLDKVICALDKKNRSPELRDSDSNVIRGEIKRAEKLIRLREELPATR